MPTIKEPIIKESDIRKIVLEILHRSNIEKKYSGEYYTAIRGHTHRYVENLKLIQKLPHFDNVLDIGLGAQPFMSVILNRHFNTQVTALEHPQRPHLQQEYLKKIIDEENIKILLCDLINDKIPCKKESFDLILFCDVFEHLPIPQFYNAFKNIHHALKKDGHLIITTPNLHTIKNRIRLLLGMDIFKLPTEEPTQGHIREYSLSELRKIMENYFTIKSYRYTNMLYGPENLQFIVKSLNVISSMYPRLRDEIHLICKKV